MMDKLLQLWRRLLFYLQRDQFDREMEEEMRFHLEMKAEENLAAAISPEEARYAARRQFGNQTLLREVSRDMWAVRSIETLWQDLRYGLRMMVKNAGFTLVTVLTLALGIGANTTIFSLVDAVLMKSMPVKEPDRLIQFKWMAGSNFKSFNYDGSSRLDETTRLFINTSFTQQAFEQFRERQSAFTELFAFATLEQVNANVNGEAEVADGLVVSGGYFPGLGVQPEAGRMITAEDDRPDSQAVVVLSHRYWEHRFGASVAVIGKQINLNNAAFTIVGVTPRDFTGTLGRGRAPDLTIPLMMESRVRGNNTNLNQQSLWWLLLMGRLKTGATPEQAHAQFDPIFQRAALENLDRPSNQTQAGQAPRLVVASGRRGDTEWSWYQQQSLYLLMAVVGLVLLVACANVAGLLLARGAERQKEIAVRLALGTGRRRLVRQLLTESLLLATFGGVMGLLFASWGRNLLLSLRFPGHETLPFQTGLDWRVAAFTFAVSVLTGLLFGTLPAWRTTRVDLTPALKGTGRSSAGYARSLAGKSLIVAQVALSLLLLVGAGLFLRTLLNLQNVAPGFNPQNLLLFRVDPRLSGYRGDRLANLYRRIFDRIEAVPGVRSVTFSRHPLLSGSSQGTNFSVVGESVDPHNRHSINVHIVGANFFETMGLSIQLGRGLRQSDDANASRAVIINQALARNYFSGENPIGKRLWLGLDQSAEWEIVGVARDAKYTSLRDEVPATIYVSWLQVLDRVGQMNFEVRTAGDPVDFIAAIRHAVREVDGNLPLFDVKTQVEQVSQSLAQEQLFASLLSFFALLALGLASLGLYGVLAFSVTQRTHEIGIRMALGAKSSDVLRLVISQGMNLTLVGVVIGLGGTLALTRLLKTMLYGVSATDPLTFTLIALLLALVALLACWIPARRAAKVDPITALRFE